MSAAGPVPLTHLDPHLRGALDRGGYPLPRGADPVVTGWAGIQQVTQGDE